MRFLKTNTAVRVTVGPFFDKTDGVTPETALTVTACKLTLVVDTGDVPTLVLDTNPTASGGANDMVHITGDDAGFYDLELAAANVNYVGRAMLALTDAATHCPVFHEFMILPAMVYDSFVGGSDTLQVDVTQFGGTNGTFASGRPEVNTSHVAGSAISQSAGLINANVTQFGGSAGTFASGRPEVNTTHAAGTAWGSGAITAASIASDAITAAKIATGAIDADALATDAVAEIADGVWDEATAGHVTAGSTGVALTDILTDTGTTLQAEVDGIQADTEDIQARLPSALVGGRIDANVGAISGDATAADNLESYTDGSEYMPVNAFAPKWSTTVTPGSVTAYKPDNVTVATTRTITQDPTADPITSAT